MSYVHDDRREETGSCKFLEGRSVLPSYLKFWIDSFSVILHFLVRQRCILIFVITLALSEHDWSVEVLVSPSVHDLSHVFHGTCMLWMLAVLVKIMLAPGTPHSARQPSYLLFAY